MGTAQTWHHREGDIVHKYTLETSGRLTREVRSVNQAQVLDLNRRRRLEPDSMRKMDWGVAALDIPEAHYHVLCSKYPDLKCWDSSIRAKAWEKFMQSDASKPYRVREKI